MTINNHYTATDNNKQKQVLDNPQNKISPEAALRFQTSAEPRVQAPISNPSEDSNLSCDLQDWINEHRNRIRNRSQQNPNSEPAHPTPENTPHAIPVTIQSGEPYDLDKDGLLNKEEFTAFAQEKPRTAFILLDEAINFSEQNDEQLNQQHGHAFIHSLDDKVLADLLSAGNPGRDQTYLTKVIMDQSGIERVRDIVIIMSEKYGFEDVGYLLRNLDDRALASQINAEIRQVSPELSKQIDDIIVHGRVIPSANAEQKVAIEGFLKELYQRYPAINSANDGTSTVTLRPRTTQVTNGDPIEVLSTPEQTAVIEALLDKYGVFYQKNEDGNDAANRLNSEKVTEFDLFPGLSRDDIAFIQTPGDVFKENLVIVQGEYARIKPGDDKVKQLSTYGIASCRGIVIKNDQTGEVLLAHLDQDSITDMAVIKRFLSEMGLNASNATIQTTDNLDPLIQKAMQKNGYKLSTDLPRDFSVNVNTGEITDFDIMDHPEIKDHPVMQQRLDFLDIRQFKGAIDRSPQ